ncbi:unnamed protein product [Adineta steineri]|uniref:Uncharacterized protein n=2 Tax=Adineta steineri TaxID=433720 RepID=A0A815YAZ3_9BILA|nr:unnamed protein product [Adineta steineri]CAF1567888.1 unnamed protein product [Adineta steineri]
MEGNEPGQYRIHWPPVFPNVWLVECDLLQLDVSIRTEYVPPIPCAEANDISFYDNDDDEDANLYNDNTMSIFDFDDSESIFDEIDDQWIDFDIIIDEWVNVHNHEDSTDAIDMY